MLTKLLSRIGYKKQTVPLDTEQIENEMQIPEWDEYFMTMVYLVSMRSKDQSTHIGAVIVGPDREVRSTGYNSFPIGLNDTVQERQQRPEKYFWFEHAERSAILLAARTGISLAGCTMYTQGIPCADCARAVIQAGIKEVVLHKQWSFEEGQQKWAESGQRSAQMFEECGIKVRYYDGPLMKVTGLRGGKVLDF
jgi:dCMP deaminase